VPKPVNQRADVVVNSRANVIINGESVRSFAVCAAQDDTAFAVTVAAPTAVLEQHRPKL
jgi:flagellar basal body P-ring protein FlgI